MIETSAMYFQQLAKTINELSSGDRPVLVFFESLKHLETFRKSPEFARQKMFAKVLSEETDAAAKDALVQQAAAKGAITLLTKELGRGTDFVCYDKTVDLSGGVHVIQTFLSEQKSEEAQIKGRTARQGKRGSYQLILKAEDLEKFRINGDDIARMRGGDDGAYMTLDEKRNAYFDEVKYPESIAGVEGIKRGHGCAMKVLEELRRPKPKAGVVVPYLTELNKGIFSESGPSRTMVLMDATGSMDGLLNKCKQRVHEMFNRAQAVLKDHGLEVMIEMQFVCYRNCHNCGHDSQHDPYGRILEISQWSSNPQDLKVFMTPIEANGGIGGEESIEIAFQHVNNEALELEESETPVKQVILIGDAAPSTQEQVTERRENFGIAYWDAFAEETYWETEVAKLQQKSIPVHAFYLKERAEASFRDIAGRTGGESHPLDVDSDAGAEDLTNVVTERILEEADKDMGGALVLAYRKAYPKGYL
jgi:hypothetical protein